MKNIHQSALFLVSLILFSSSMSLAQSPAASPKPAPKKPSPAAPKSLAPVPAAAKPLVPTLPQSPDSSSDSTPDDITKILKKAKVFTVFGRLLKTTEIINNVNSQIISAKSGGLTILAPDDNSFSELKAGFLNSLTNRQKIELLQFHILPVYVASNNFDSLNNPVQTLAGDNNPKRLEMDVVAMGDSVNITTGVVNATIKGVVYTDRQLAIYRVDKVLIPKDLVLPQAAPAAAPAGLAKTPKADKGKSSSSSSGDDDDSADDTSSKEKSAAVGVLRNEKATLMMSFGVALVVGGAMWC